MAAIADSPMATTAAPSFSVFQRLPKELRVYIWKYAELNHTREVQVEIKRIDRSGMATLALKALTPVPPTLHTCRESRIEGLKRYTLAFKDFDGTEKRSIYFNPSTEVLYIRTPPRFDDEIHKPAASIMVYWDLCLWTALVEPLGVFTHSWHAEWLQHFLIQATITDTPFKGMPVAVAMMYTREETKNSVIIVKSWEAGEGDTVQRYLDRIGIKPSPEAVVADKFDKVFWWDEAWTVFLKHYSER